MKRPSAVPDTRSSNRWLHARHGRPVGLALAAVLVVVTLCADWPPEPGLRNSLFDTYQKVLPFRPANQGLVVVVDIDDTSLVQMGQWPWPRSELARLIDRIAAQHPLAIGIDMVFPEGDRWSPRQQAKTLISHGVIPADAADRLPDYDQQLADSLVRAKAVVGVSGVSSGEGLPARIPYRPMIREFGDPATDHVTGYASAIRSIDVLDRAGPGHGLINKLGERDGMLRRVPVLGSVAGDVIPGFAFEVLRQAVKDPVVSVHSDRIGVRKVGIGGFEFPTDPDGTVWLHFSRQRARISAYTVLRDDFAPDTLTDAVVLLGSTSTGLGDVIVTPAGMMAGVDAHAQAIENVLDRRVLVRPWWAPLSEAALLALLALIGIAAIPTRRPTLAALALIGGIVLAAGFGAGAFLWKAWLIDVATPAIAASLVFAVMLILTLNAAEAHRNRLRQALAATREEQARIEGELDAARRIQTGMLPSPESVVGDDRRLDLAAIMRPARTVGGDLYDFFLIDRARLFFMAGDVSGKGLPASLFMALSKALIKGAAMRIPNEPGRSLTEAGNIIAQENPESMFVSVAAGVLDLNTGDFAWCCAGHDSPYLARRGVATARRLETPGGPALCMVDRFVYPTERMRLSPGDTLCIVTDGVTEAANPRRELFGTERLAASLAAAGDEASSRAVVERLRRDVETFAQGVEQADDLTILVLRWRGPG